MRDVLMIDRTGLTEQEINLIEHCVALEEQEIIDSDGVVISGKETEFGFANLGECLQTVFDVDEAASTNSINKFNDFKNIWMSIILKKNIRFVIFIYDKIFYIVAKIFIL